MKGDESRGLRKRMKLTRRRLGQRPGVTRNTVARWQRNEMKINEPAVKFVRILAKSSILKTSEPYREEKRREREMLSIVLPRTFKIGDTQAARVNKQQATLFWRDKDTMVLNGTDTRKILLTFDDGALRHFACTEADGTPRAVDVIVEGWTIKVRERAN